MKIQIVVVVLSLLNSACSKSLLRDVEDDFEKSIGQLATVIDTKTRIGASRFESSLFSIRYILEVDTQHTVSRVESIEQEVIQKIKDLGNELCYQTGKSELAELSSNANQKVSKNFKTTMEDMYLTFMVGMAKLRQYQDITSVFRKKFQKCSDDVCKQEILEEVMEQVGVIGGNIEEYVNRADYKIQMYLADYEMEILVPVLDGLRKRSSEILQKAIECVEGQKM